MVAADYPSAVRAGTMAAARLHQQLDLRRQIEAAGGDVYVFAAIHAVDLPLLLRPLQGLPRRRPERSWAGCPGYDAVSDEYSTIHGGP